MKRLLLPCLLVALLSGCRYYTIDSNPQGLRVVINDIEQGDTPTSYFCWASDGFDLVVYPPAGPRTVSTWSSIRLPTPSGTPTSATASASSPPSSTSPRANTSRANVPPPAPSSSTSSPANIPAPTPPKAGPSSANPSAPTPPPPPAAPASTPSPTDNLQVSLEASRFGGLALLVGLRPMPNKALTTPLASPPKGAFLRPYKGPRSTTIVVGGETL